MADATMADAPRVFLSYSHDSDEHADRVLALADALRNCGINVILDRYIHPAPEEGWPRWMDNNLDAAKFILVVCTETYRRRVMGQEEPGRGGQGMAASAADRDDARDPDASRGSHAELALLRRAGRPKGAVPDEVKAEAVDHLAQPPALTGDLGVRAGQRRRERVSAAHAVACRADVIGNSAGTSDARDIPRPVGAPRLL